jgi:hypothetical protein
MRQTNGWKVLPEDVSILRDLVRRKREIAQDPVMEERRQLWTALHSLERTRPMILAETSGVRDELVPISTLQCQEEWARGMERGLRELLFRCEQVGDDFVVEPRITYGWHVTVGDYGVEIPFVRAENEGRLGSGVWDPPLKDLDRDLDKLHFRELSVDRDSTFAWRELLQDLFGDILPVVNRGWYWWTTGLTGTAIRLAGLGQLMMLMYDNPKGLHRLMAFLRDDMLHYLDWFEEEGLLPLNNEDDYVGSGGIGYTPDLPQADWQENQPVRVRDMWGLSESQETVGVSPAMFEEFVFQYQVPIISRFGLSYYGCCEPIHARIGIIKRLPNLRSLSVSPWCDQEIMVDELGQDYVFCRKPKPTLISTVAFDEDLIREDIRSTLRIAGECPLEFAMKDVHTVSDQPWRMGRWVEIVREVSTEFGYA